MLRRSVALWRCGLKFESTFSCQLRTWGLQLCSPQIFEKYNESYPSDRVSGTNLVPIQSSDSIFPLLLPSTALPHHYYTIPLYYSPPTSTKVPRSTHAGFPEFMQAHVVTGL